MQRGRRVSTKTESLKGMLKPLYRRFSVVSGYVAYRAAVADRVPQSAKLSEARYELIVRRKNIFESLFAA